MVIHLHHFHHREYLCTRTSGSAVMLKIRRKFQEGIKTLDNTKQAQVLQEKEIKITLHHFASVCKEAALVKPLRDKRARTGRLVRVREMTRTNHLKHTKKGQIMMLSVCQWHFFCCLQAR